jgi:type IX secretion system PorP/SprF family membrane protein
MNIPENFDRWMFDYKEGNLSGAEKEAFERFLIQNPEFEVEADAWNNAFIENEEFIYPHADALQKDRKVVAGWYGWSAAAIALILIGSTVFYFNNDSSSEVEGFSSSEIAGENQEKPISTNSNQAEIAKSSIQLSHQLEEMRAYNSGEVATSVIQNIISNNPSNGFAGSQTGNPNRTRNNSTFDPNSNGSAVIAGNQSSNVSPSINTDEVSMTDPTANKVSMDQEIAKYETDDYKTKYADNPDGKELEFDVAKNDKYDAKNWQNKVKSIYRKIEKMFDYPVGLTNLRDPEILIPGMNNPMAMNPGFAGGMLAPRFEMNYRNQWFGNDQNSQQLTMAFDSYIYEMRGGVGLIVNAKDYGYGEFNDVSVSMAYSPKISLGSNVLFEPAVRLTMGMMNGNGAKLAPDSQFELDRGRLLSTPAAQQMGGQRRLWYKDYGLGFVLNTEWFYAGFSADNLNRHFENVYNVEGYATPTSTPVMISAILGTDYDFKRKPMSFSPFVAYQQFGQRKEIWGGFNYRLNAFTIGGSISQNVDFTASVGMKFENFKLIYSYDHTKSTLNDTQIGSHNIGIRINGSNKKKRLK